MKKAILTGATGFIGSWMLEELLRNNVEITALVCDNPERIAKEIRNNIITIPYNPDALDAVMGNVGKNFDVLYNIGWAGVAPEIKNQLEVQLNNVRHSIDLVYFSKKIGVARFIGIGTVAEYVYCDGLIHSSQPPSPADIYGAAKVSTHFLCQAVAEDIGIEFNWTIIPSTFGERRIDNNLITYTIRTLLQGSIPQFTKLEQMWDFLYIADVVRGLYLIGECGLPGKMYGIGSGIYRPLHSYITEIRDLIDPNLKLDIGAKPYTNNRISSSCVDNQALIEDTGFKVNTTFRQGIVNTIEYFRRNG